MSTLKQLKAETLALKNPAKAQILQNFFKTNPGEYGEGDIFYGITVPESRKLAIKYSSLSLEEIESLLKSEIHEERLIAVLILVHNYKNGSDSTKQEIYNFYLSNTKRINNWDLVDLSAHKILGAHLLNKPRDILYKLSSSSNLWDRRIAIISTFHFIRNSDFHDTLKLAKILLKDNHDLIHKSVGWMLREIGKRDLPVLESFLKQYYKQMPRTMLRYAIERFPEEKRQAYLKGEIK
jgi:3-methyladenine DNA glycosylase AlkD